MVARAAAGVRGFLLACARKRRCSGGGGGGGGASCGPGRGHGSGCRQGSRQHGRAGGRGGAAVSRAPTARRGGGVGSVDEPGLDQPAAADAERAAAEDGQQEAAGAARQDRGAAGLEGLEGHRARQEEDSQRTRDGPPGAALSGSCFPAPVLRSLRCCHLQKDAKEEARALEDRLAALKKERSRRKAALLAADRWMLTLLLALAVALTAHWLQLLDLPARLDAQAFRELLRSALR